jgi:hypothetical protein
VVGSCVRAAWLWLMPLLVVGCSFDTSTKGLGGKGDGSPVVIDASGNMLDANTILPDADPNLPDADPNQPDASPDCLVWDTDFASDPTLLDLNGDGQPDWAERDGNNFPTNELSGGIWTSPSFSAVLDTNPKQDFAGRTTLTGQLRSTVVSTQYGAVFWINVDYTSTDFAPLFVGVQLEINGTQTLTLYGRNVVGIDAVLATVSGLGGGGIDVTLEINAGTDQVTLTVESLPIGTYTYTKLERMGNDDRQATAVAYGNEAQFNFVRVESCP